MRLAAGTLVKKLHVQKMKAKRAEYPESCLGQLSYHKNQLAKWLLSVHFGDTE